MRETPSARAFVGVAGTYQVCYICPEPVGGVTGMSAFEAIWLPEVEAEYLRLIAESRDVGFDVGNQFRSFERILETGLDAAWRPIDRAGRADLYVMYARHAVCYFALAGRRAAVVKWTTAGTDYALARAAAEARQRATRLFPSAPE